MTEGTIKWFNVRKGYGFIEQDEGGDLFIHINQWRGPSGSEPLEGNRVTFEVGPGRKGKLEAKNVRPAGMEPVRPVEEPRRKVTPARPGGYRFLNPYNFVRPLSQPRENGQVLGNCPPPPHDRYVDGLLTGRITCSVTAVTPLFISDSHAVKVGENKHKTFRFFEYDGEPAIPASSLRGMIRSVFETVTNSCFSVFSDQRLSHRFDTRLAPQLVPGRVEKHKGKWELHLLAGTTPLQVGSEPRGKQYAAWVHRYRPMKPSGTLSNPSRKSEVQEFQQRTRPGTEVDLKGLQHGSECYALLAPRKHPFPSIRFWDVLEVSRKPDGLERICKPNRGQRVVRGWLCLTNQNIEPKHSERLFFRDPKNTVGPEYIELPESVRDAYENLIRDYQERHAKQVDKRGESPGIPISEEEAGFSRFIYTKEASQLSDGTLVYAYLSDTVENPKVEFIAPVSIPRVGYDHSIGDLLDPGVLPENSDLHKCRCYNQLCPACRVFGWIRKVQPGEKLASTVRTAYAGRIRLTHATGVDGTVQRYEKPVILSILSSPKPTTTQFYLLKDGEPDSRVDYDTPNAQLRGRKFYRHHGKEPSKCEGGKYEYERVGDVQDDQNRTVRGVVKEGSEFTFALEFENLHPLELGALLWALELEEGMHHRLGYGKPLGFGSVTLKIDHLKALSPEKRYSDLSSDSWQDPPVGKEGLIEAFKKAMQIEYSTSFDGLLEELRDLFSDPTISAIHYPREREVPTEKGENFKWFVGNKRRDEPIPLDLSADDAGLPLMDERGRIRR